MSENPGLSAQARHIRSILNDMGLIGMSRVETNEGVLLDRVLAVSSNDDHWDPVGCARVRLSRKDIERIVELADLAKDHDIESVRDASVSAEWGHHDEHCEGFISAEDPSSPDWFRAECEQAAIFVTKDWQSVCWTAYERHSSVEVATVDIDVAALRSLIAEPALEACSGVR